MPISDSKELFKLPVKKVNVKRDLLWKRGKIMSGAEGGESDFCFSASGQCVTACLHGTLEKLDLKVFFQKGHCNTCLTL